MLLFLSRLANRDHNPELDIILVRSQYDKLMLVLAEIARIIIGSNNATIFDYNIVETATNLYLIQKNGHHYLTYKYHNFLSLEYITIEFIQPYYLDISKMINDLDWVLERNRPIHVGLYHVFSAVLFIIAGCMIFLI